MDGNNIQGLSIFCFGYLYQNKNPKECWWSVANSSISQGWHNANLELLQSSLSHDLKIGQHTLIAIQFKDVGSDTVYTVHFSNKEKKWKIKIPNSKSLDGVPTEDKKTFFKCPLFTNTCKRAVEILEKVKNTMESVLTEHITAGDLPKINEIEYKTVLDYLNDPELMRNLKLHKYVK